MVSTRAILLTLLAVGASTSVLAIPAERPYAPALYDRQSLEQSSQHEKRSLEAARPYSPDLYFRRALTTNEMDDVKPTKSFAKRSSSAVGKRSAGAGCADDLNACSQGHFCSTVNFRCQQKRGSGGHCRSTDGCEQGFQCLNFKCIEQAFEQGIQEFQEHAKEWESSWPQPSGSAKWPHHFKKRQIDWSNLPQEIQNQLSNLPSDLENLPQEIQDKIDQWWQQPSPSGSARKPKHLGWK